VSPTSSKTGVFYQYEYRESKIDEMTLMQMAVSTGAYQCFGVRCRIVALRLRADDPAPRESGASSGGSRARRETSTRLWPVTSPRRASY
jgi:hypothetical protein